MPKQLGLAGFNGVELLQGLPRKLATMDACRQEIGRIAAEIIVDRAGEDSAGGKQVVMTPSLDFGDTLRRW